MTGYDEEKALAIEKLKKDIQEIAQQFIYRPDTAEQRVEMEQLIRQRMKTFTDVLGVFPGLGITFNPEDMVIDCGIIEPEEVIDCTNIHEHIDGITNKAQECITDYIADHYDKYDIKEYQGYIYQIITDKSYEIIVELLNKDYQVKEEDFDTIVEQIYESLDFNDFYELIDDISNSAVTMEDKLAEVGMSYKDFI